MSSSLQAPFGAPEATEGVGRGPLAALLQLLSTLACLAVAFAGVLQLQGNGTLELR